MQEERSSFRDPAGQVFTDGKRITREIYPPYFANYDLLLSSGLYRELIDNGLLIPHEESGRCEDEILITPEVVPFISYPYEWCFSMLKEAALNTLRINRTAIDHGMMLKDASAYNMQFYKGNMMLIDTTSFIKYEMGMPWGAYRQFLQHFLCPLFLMANVDPSLNRISALHLDGIPMKLTAKLLPNRLHFSPGVLMHLYAQSLDVTVRGNKKVGMSRYALYSLLANLEGLVRGIKYTVNSDWTKYGEADSYTVKGKEWKRAVVSQSLLAIPAGTLLDIGCNDGLYSLLAHGLHHQLIATDRDHDCIEQLYRAQPSVLSLVMDICNPSPAIGLDNTERQSFLDRAHVDTIMALALIHHLCIGNNIPLARIAGMLARQCKNLIIEWVPPDDPKAQLLLGKKNIPPYSATIFHNEFSKYFVIKQVFPIADSQRIIYLMEKR